ncbi:hypothetical protein SR870_01700 [Rhodopseudomonas palustris]|uniref:hypothetical protein n=1 Tax=Rhodopseudomonas palustris TaxID=1076 RepID=UPI002ACDEFF6|nr:hypothetical protein [Rhodopseudomonas palustris]WQH00034.1 hypothetical protein SR870_01700 [Rhodopseudomonas palustris]
MTATDAADSLPLRSESGSPDDRLLAAKTKAAAVAAAFAGSSRPEPGAIADHIESGVL